MLYDCKCNKYFNTKKYLTRFFCSYFVILLQNGDSHHKFVISTAVVYEHKKEVLFLFRRASKLSGKNSTSH